MNLSETFLMLLMSPPSQGDDNGKTFGNIFFLAAIILVFYFFMIRPQTKKMKDQKKFQLSLQKGDKVVTIGGVHGKITGTTEKAYIIESEGTKLKIDISAISMDLTKKVQEEKEK